MFHETLPFRWVRKGSCFWSNVAQAGARTDGKSRTGQISFQKRVGAGASGFVLTGGCLRPLPSNSFSFDWLSLRQVRESGFSVLRRFGVSHGSRT